MRTIIETIAGTTQAYKNCIHTNNIDWAEKHENTLLFIEKNYLPHGSGIDCGCKIDIEKSNNNKVIINFSFHHMNPNGFYCGWSDYKAIIKPSFYGIDLRITGKNTNYIKDYLYSLFYDCLTACSDNLPMQ